MCVAVVVDTRENIPLKNLEAMEKSNPDGAGIAWVDGDNVHFRKGLTAAQIFEIQDGLPRPLFIHFRIATRGAKIPELTHPFPVGMQSFLGELSGTAQTVFMHNGTWPEYRKYVPEGIDADKVSDTQTAAYALTFDESILVDVVWSNAIMQATGNGRNSVSLRGRWTEENGIWYSNTYWKSELNRTAYKHWGNRPSWGEDEWQAFYGKREEGRGGTPDLPRTVTPLVPRRKGLSHQEGRFQENGKSLSRRQQKRLAKIAKRAEKKSAKKVQPSSSYEKALKAYNDNRNAYWNGEELFTPEAIARAEADIMAGNREVDCPCPDCGVEIEIIPCPCNNWTAEQWINHHFKDDPDLALEARAAIAMSTQAELDFSDEEDTIEIIDADVVDVQDVEDMNAYGMACGLDGGLEGLEDLTLDGNRPGDAQRVNEYLSDSYIRSQGIKI